MQKLTEKQEKFISGLLRGLSQREAYKQAYNASKMKDKTMDENACKLLKNTKVAARYNQLRNEIIKKAEEETILSAHQIMEYWSSVVKGKTKSSVVVIEAQEDGTTQAREMHKTPDEKEKLKASELLAKYYGLDKKVMLDERKVVLAEKQAQEVDGDIEYEIEEESYEKES